ncbi:MAG: thiol-disulfide oxidoreductase DCC family protein [Bacteroidia bacterium]
MNPGIIIFDGHCNLCNGLVDFLIKRDKKRRFRYMANQSEAGQILLSQLGEDPANVETFFFYQNDVLLKRSSAALAVSGRLPFPFFLAKIGWIIPGFLRDTVYRWIARNRYRWFGKQDSCRLATAEEQSMFIESREDLNRVLI